MELLGRTLFSKSKRVLNIGSGPSLAVLDPVRYKDMRQQRLDIDPRVKPEICCDAREMTLHVAKNSYDAVFCSHNLEHYYHHDVSSVLSGMFYILKSGEVLVEYKPFDGPRIVVARIKPGDVFGWSAALGHAVYTSSARAIASCSTYRLNGKKLQQLCARHPEAGVIIMEKLSSVISNRLNSTRNLMLSHFIRQVEDQNSGIIEIR